MTRYYCGLLCDARTCRYKAPVRYKMYSMCVHGRAVWIRMRIIQKRKYSKEGGEPEDKMPGSATPRQSRAAADDAAPWAKAGTASCNRKPQGARTSRTLTIPQGEGCDGTSRFGLGRCRIAQRFAILFSFSFVSCPTHSRLPPCGPPAIGLGDAE